MKNRGIVIAGVVVVVAIVAFAIYRSVAPAAPAPSTPQAAASQTTSSTWPRYPHEVSDDEVAKHDAPRITPDELLPLFKSGAVTIVDVRDLDSYTTQHITGALHMPLAQVESMLGLLPKGKPVVFYCTWPDEESSAGAVLIANHAGITNAKALRGGLHAWIDRGYPTESGNQ